MEKKLIAGRKTFQIVIAAFLVVCVLIAAACWLYYKSLQDAVTNESGGYMQEISQQIGANVGRTINDNFSVLGTVSTVLKNTNIDSFEKMQPIVREQQTYWGYKNIYLIDEAGNAQDAYGHTVSMGGDDTVRQAVVQGVRAMSTSQVVDGEEVLLFVIPVEGLDIGGVEYSALAASYDPGTFNKALSMTAFDGKGYCSLNKRDGTVVVRSGGVQAAPSGYNTLSTLASSAQMDKGDDLETVRSNIAAGESGMVGFTMNGVHTYMAYTPLETREWCLMTFVPVSVVNANTQRLMQLTLAMCGVITLTFAALLGTLMLVTYRHGRKLERLAFVDEVTGGDTMQRFYAQAGALLEAADHPPYALVYTNVEKFKVLNEQFGREACDELLRSLWQGPAEDLSGQECAARITADNFCVLVKWEGQKALVERVQHWYEMAAAYHEKSGRIWMEPIMGMGVYPIGEEVMPFDYMIDRAKLALRETAGELTEHVRCAVYDDAVRRKLFRDKQLEDMMEGALKAREFVVYLQPKYELEGETIGGAEALVRWKSASEGMIFPDEFIPLFEKNGFIVQLDLYVFGEVCRTIRRWLDAGLEPVKISVNCSRVNLKNANFLERYQEICGKWRIPPEYIEIELTENLVFENVERLGQIIDDIHAAGFGCSMDDFGSGYSSLNMIQDIPVDTIKLDRIFFRTVGRVNERTESVVGCILSMTKALHMVTVAEGVEERSQVEMLRRLGCDYIQGYYYAKPMPISEFERSAFGRELEEVPV